MTAREAPALVGRVLVGPVLFGFTLLWLSRHAVVVEVLGWAIPIQEQGERPLFASLAIALAGLAFVAYGAFGGLGARRARAATVAEAGAP